MSTASEISVVRVPLPAERAGHDAALEQGVGDRPPPVLPRTRRPSPATLATLAVLAGLVAMALGGLAVFSAARSNDDTEPPQAAAVAAARSSSAVAERRVLALLAKPSTERVLFRGSGGRLMLAVGSGGRAALLIRGLEPAPAEKPYQAWIVGTERAVRAARFSGRERAILLSRPVGRGASVVIAPDRMTALRPGQRRLAATRP